MQTAVDKCGARVASPPKGCACAGKHALKCATALSMFTLQTASANMARQNRPAVQVPLDDGVSVVICGKTLPKRCLGTQEMRVTMASYKDFV